MELEHPDLFIRFYSTHYTQQYLTQLYEKQQIDYPDTKGYHACYSFIYHLQQGQQFMSQSRSSPTAIKPILLYYGLVQFLKACILTINPDYPENSQVLAHGVSTRKRKKSSYCFLNDEVKIQKNGLFSYFLQKLFHMEHTVGEKYTMNLLLKHIADMHPLFQEIKGKNISYQGKQKGQLLLFPSSVLDAFHMTPNRFGQYIERFPYSYYQKGQSIQETNNQLVIPLKTNSSLVNTCPWRFDVKGRAYLLNKRADIEACLLPEIAVHYLLLYNLSMICRYEAEWWGELLHTFDGEDLPFILHFLSITEKKIPFLISHLLH